MAADLVERNSFIVNPCHFYALDIEKALRVVKSHEDKTGTRYYKPRHDTPFGTTSWNYEENQIQWPEEDRHVRKHLAFDGVPYILLESKCLGCKYGAPNAGKQVQGEHSREEEEDDDDDGVRKGQCPAKVILREVIKFPDYKVDGSNTNEKKKYSKMLEDDLASGTVRPERRIYVELPYLDEHIHTVLAKRVNEVEVDRPIFQRVNEVEVDRPNHCLVCNAKLSSTARSTIAIFSRDARTSHRQLELTSVLGRIIEEEMEESSLHSSILCSKCYNLIDDVDSLEEQLVYKKQIIANKYRRTIAEINHAPEPEGPSINYLIEDEAEDEDFVDVSYGKPRSKRGRGRGRPPGRGRGRGTGRPRGKPKGSVSKKSTSSNPKPPEKCVIKVEFDPDKEGGHETVFYPAPAPINGISNSQPVRTIKQENLMQGEEESLGNQLLAQESDLLDDEINPHEVAETEMPMVEGNVTMELQGDVLNVVEEVFEEDEVKSEKTFTCLDCGKNFLTKAAWRNHIKVHTHLDSYDCEDCEKSFATKYRLKAHLKTHVHRNRPHLCRVCNKAFYTRYHLNTHLKSHDGVRNFVCELCGKALSTQKTLELHALTHTGEKPYQCEICGSTFRQRSNLHTHIKTTHYQEKNYHCEICQKSFARKRLLVYHQNSVHTGDRPYKCELCTASFVYPHYYKRHLRKHTGVKPHKCQVCGKAFASRENRNAHMFTHSDKKPYECKICGAGFMRKPLCATHLSVHGHTNNAEDFIIFNSPSLLVTAASQEEIIVAEEDEAARAVQTVRISEEPQTQETIEEPVQIMQRDGKVVKMISRPVHIIDVIHTTDRGRDENMEHFFAALQGQVVEVRSEDF